MFAADLVIAGTRVCCLLGALAMAKRQGTLRTAWFRPGKKANLVLETESNHRGQSEVDVLQQRDTNILHLGVSLELH